MQTTSFQFPKLPFSGPRRQTGWVGIDIGSNAIKMAQVERFGDAMRIVARWSLRFDNSDHLSRENLNSHDFTERMEKVRETRRMFLRRECAVVLPCSIIDHHSFEIPAGSLAEQRQMIGEELAADLGVEQEELVYDFWSVPTDGKGQSETGRVEVASVRREIAIRIAKAMNRAKMDCQLLSAMPVAIAHAVELAAPEGQDETLCGINLGMTCTTIVLVRNGIPVFTRVIRTNHLLSIMQPLQQALQLSPDEARQLLAHIGLSTSNAYEHASSSVIMQRIEPAVDALISEIGRTFEFFHRQPERLYPSRLFLMGGGGVIKNLPQVLENRLQVAVSPWSLPNSPPDLSDPLFAMAASLSTMAWED